MPRSARLLGFSGILPAFAAVLVAIFHDARDIQLFATAIALLYGGLILSFIGGAWWGLAAKQADQSHVQRALVISVIPSLYAWGAVACGWIIADYALSALLLSAGFAVSLYVDKWLIKQGTAPAWWMTLRNPLSTAMCMLFLALAAESYM